MRRDVISGARRRAGRALDRYALDRVQSRPRLKESILSKHAPPRLLDLEQASGTTHETALSLLQELVRGVDGDRINQYCEEFLHVEEEIVGRDRGLDRSYPEYFTIEEQTSRFLYVAVRLLTPDLVLETGVADGRSTAVTLAALAANDRGELHSIEISQDVGGLVHDRSRWRLHVLDPATRQFEEFVEQLPEIDIFLHDGDHSYEAQTREYEAVWPRMRKDGLFLSDDIDYSWAFLHFMDRRDRRPHLLMERRKAVGAVRR